MSFALKRKFPQVYKILKKFEKYVPAFTKLWDNKNYLVNLKIVSMLRYWRHYPRLKVEADIVYNHYDGGDFIDVGAYEGIYSFLLAPKAKKNDTFISCEPNFKEKQILTENLYILKRLFNKIKFVANYNPVGDGNYVISVPTPYGHPVFKNKTDYSLNSNDESASIKSISIDELVMNNKLRPKFIKIDIEGAEFSVLQGMTNVLEKHSPSIMIEKHPTLIPKTLKIFEIDNFLIKKGYKIDKSIFKDDIAITEIWKKSC
jgi:FkbM family methyltransferase